MKKVVTLFVIILLVSSCQSNLTNENDKFVNDTIKQKTEQSLIDILENKFGKPFSSEKTDNIYMVYKWQSFENEYGKQFKNEIDKKLNILPFKSDTKLKKNKGNAEITDIYEWETPNIYVKLLYTFFGENGNIKSNIILYVNQK